MSDRTASDEGSSTDDHLHKRELAVLASRYSLGSPLSRVRTRTDSTCLWQHVSPDAPNRGPSAPPHQVVLYDDEFVTLTATALVVRHLLFRREVKIPLARIHTARAFCSPAQLVKLAAAGRPSSPSTSTSTSPSSSSSRRRTKHGPEPRAPRGVVVSGLGSTGVIWARDPARIKDERWRERAVVVDAEGWLGRVGFTVDDAEAWWAAWAQATGQAHC
ncbi:hypothetical protein JCM9279_006806 [Rhodotorula babjevae]